MIDDDGYRFNVGIVICNPHGQVFWGKRFGKNSWQFPQGGVDEGESATQAMFRELHEEVGLCKNDVTILCQTKQWLKYKLPKHLIRVQSNPVCIGQKQKWFLLRLENEDKIDLFHSGSPEFDEWKWVNFWYPIRQIVSFKKDVYRRVMKEFVQPTAAQQQDQNIILK